MGLAYSKMFNVQLMTNPSMSLEEWASSDRILLAAALRDHSSVAVYNRYIQHFRNVVMRGLTDGYIRRFICIDVRADGTCRRSETAQEVRSNEGKVVNPSHYWNGNGGCMTAAQKELLWAVSVSFEAQAQALKASGEMSLNMSELSTRFAQAPYRDCEDTAVPKTGRSKTEKR